MTPYYEQLEKRYLKKLKSFQSDLTTHDKNSLNGYVGQFVWSMREYGTDLALLDEWHKNPNAKKRHFNRNVENNWEYLTAERNDIFVHGKNGKIKEITKKEALDLI